MVNSKKKLTLGGILYALLLLHLLWEIASLLINKPILPGPIPVYQHFPALFAKQMQWHIYFSLTRLFWSLLIATVLGLFFGVLMGTSPRFAKLLNPIVYFTYPIPKIALLPIIMLLFGLGEASKITLITLVIVFQMIIAVRDRVQEIPPTMYQPLQVLHASRRQLFWQITLPASTAALISTLRVALGTAIAILFFTEVYGTQYGLGYFIMDAWNRLDYLDMYAAILVLSFVAFLLFLILEGLEKRFVKGA